MIPGANHLFLEYAVVVIIYIFFENIVVVSQLLGFHAKNKIWMFKYFVFIRFVSLVANWQQVPTGIG